VKGKLANGNGLYDMLGNAWEWCWDWNGTYPTEATTDPTGATSGSVRVIRGGSWYSSTTDARAARRWGDGPGGRSQLVGFRLARSMPIVGDVAISPAAPRPPPRGSITFSASGGYGSGWSWSIPTNGSGGSVTQAGVYTAGPTGGTTDVVRVADPFGNAATATVTVTAGVTITPGTPAVATGGTISFTASGGSGTGYTWMLAGGAPAPSGATVNATTGVYVAGPTGGVRDVVTVTDSLGNVAHAAISVCPAGYVVVPAGTFTMGSPADEPGRRDEETQHQVTLTRGYCMSATETTQEQWQSLMGSNPSQNSSGCATCPVEMVSWWDALAYANALSAGQGLQSCYGLTCSGTPGASGYTCSSVTFAGPNCTGYRLPTEAEWEYAARAGTTGGTYNGTSTLTECESGNTVVDPMAWFCGNASSTTHAAKGKAANVWGLYDMLGNVWEHCWDWYGPYPTASTADPTGAGSSAFRVVRGGGWGDGARVARTAQRNIFTPGNRANDVGFRPVRSLPMMAGLVVSPASATKPPRDSVAFSVTGGSGTGYAWSFATNNSGGTIDPATGAYVAGPTGGVVDTVQATDSLGNVRTVQVTVTAGVGIDPAAPTVAPHGSVSFSASGGSGTGWTWSLTSAGSGGSINATSGAYTAGAIPDSTELVRVQDSLGNVATATVSIGPAAGISPATDTAVAGGTKSFLASGGTGGPWTWTIPTNRSGATVTQAGVYTAGSGGVVDVLRAVDGLGNSATATVTVAGCPAGYVPIPAGTFTMGSPTSEPGRSTVEVEHQVTLTRGYCMKETEVTQAEWTARMSNNPSTKSAGCTTCPVETVSWWDAVTYANTLSAMQGLQSCYELTCSGTPGTSGYTCTAATFAGLGCTGYRLPTEAEWEYAARAGTTGGTYNGTSTLTGCESGNSILNPIAWFCGNAHTAHPAQGGAANGWGLYDILGNVWEWCWDQWDLTAYAATAVADPLGGTGSYRILRGGGWNGDGVDTRSANRSLGGPDYRFGYLGFRPVLTVPALPAVVISPSAPSAAAREAVTFSASGGYGSGWTWSLATNASGANISSAGVYTAGVDGPATDVVRVADPFGNAASASVTVAAPPVDASRSTVTVLPATLLANGTSSAQITVTALDAAGSPVSGVRVSLSATPAGATFVQPARTGASGGATGTVVAATAGTRTITAVAGATTITQKPTVSFESCPHRALVPERLGTGLEHGRHVLELHAFGLHHRRAGVGDGRGQPEHLGGRRALRSLRHAQPGPVAAGAPDERRHLEHRAPGGRDGRHGADDLDRDDHDRPFGVQLSERPERPAGHRGDIRARSDAHGLHGPSDRVGGRRRHAADLDRRRGLDELGDHQPRTVARRAPHVVDGSGHRVLGGRDRRRLLHHVDRDDAGLQLGHVPERVLRWRDVPGVRVAVELPVRHGRRRLHGMPGRVELRQRRVQRRRHGRPGDRHHRLPGAYVPDERDVLGDGGRKRRGARGCGGRRGRRLRQLPRTPGRWWRWWGGRCHVPIVVHGDCRIACGHSRGGRNRFVGLRSERPHERWQQLLRRDSRCDRRRSRCVCVLWRGWQWRLGWRRRGP